MIRGEYILDSGEILPNQFTTYGMQQVLKSAFWGEKRDWYMGLCARNPADMVTMDSLLEPSAVNGYERQLLPLDKSGWSKIGIINGETFVESLAVNFTPVNGPFDKFVNRLFLTDGDYVISISAAFPGGLQQIAAQVTQRYRLFFK